MSEVILIGDRAVGKTQSVRKLLEPPRGKITISNIDPRLISSDATSYLISNKLEIQAALRAPKRLSVDWIDTPGEWNRNEFQTNTDKDSDFRKYQAQLATAKAVVLLLRPYRTAGKVKISDKQLIQTHDISTKMQWCRRFSRWVTFINSHCSQLRYINLCLSKVDLLLPKDRLDRLAYSLESKGWLDRSDYVKQEFFPIDNPLFQQSLQDMKSSSMSFFAISVHNRFLLELPWLSLAKESYL
jgi:hypothetical protein